MLYLALHRLEAQGYVRRLGRSGDRQQARILCPDRCEPQGAARPEGAVGGGADDERLPFCLLLTPCVALKRPRHAQLLLILESLHGAIVRAPTPKPPIQKAKLRL